MFLNWKKIDWEAGFIAGDGAKAPPTTNCVVRLLPDEFPVEMNSCFSGAFEIEIGYRSAYGRQINNVSMSVK